MLIAAILASSGTAQNIDPIVLQPSTNFGDRNSCPELAIGPSYFAPWFPWPPSCVLIYAWIAWYPFPPRVCYIYRCTFSAFGQFFFVYFKICNRLFYFNGWSIYNNQTPSNNLIGNNNPRFNPSNFRGNANNLFAASTNLSDVTEGQNVRSSQSINCSYAASLNQQVRSSALGARY